METLEEEQLRFHHVTFPLEVKAKTLEALAEDERALSAYFPERLGSSSLS